MDIVQASIVLAHNVGVIEVYAQLDKQPHELPSEPLEL